MMHPLSDARLKVDWAKGYIRDLDKAMAAFNESKPYAVIEENKPETDEKLIKVRLNGVIPTEIQRLVGNITTDLRSALDYLVCQLAHLNGATDMKSEFPVARSRHEFESASTQRKIGKLSPDAKIDIGLLEPYKGGRNGAVWALNELRRRNIHRTLIPSAHAVTTSGPTTLAAGPTGSVSLNLPIWTKREDEFVVLTVRGSGNQYQVNLTVEICLAGIEGFEREALFPFLHHAAEFVETVINIFDRKFFSRA